jgi:hypothetical protein
MHTRCAGFRSVSQAFRQVSGARSRVPGVGYQLPGTWYLIPGTGLTPRAGYRAPRTEPEGQVPENARTGMQDRKGSDPGYPVPGTWYLAPVPNSHILYDPP